MKRANVHDERNCCREPDWIDGRYGCDDDASGKTHEARTGKRRLTDGPPACTVLD